MHTRTHARTHAHARACVRTYKHMLFVIRKRQREMIIFFLNVQQNLGKDLESSLPMEQIEGTEKAEETPEGVSVHVFAKFVSKLNNFEQF